ncbi:hypothetical protein DLP05_125 [Stenotrophomonas phage vB_SmaS_DLP_5]|uniref:Uncharacterized protein n=1 Tax=Stenotrophomonas phage vB_SmaS_DLP_5 TaxID=2044561 RepID=A0A2D2W2M0_9CAUD|nr:hypothetical protein FDJ07_gp096 [Stenotrophomonas phage vB_SmaS_DLP_5]ATS92373.1 hypothetical protein DLP05_125 [Stenotrophomonas phage vB_SmaS_DLP_5]
MSKIAIKMAKALLKGTGFVIVSREELATAHAYMKAVDDELVVRHILDDKNGADPKQALHDICSWDVQVALDPAVSADARRLIEQGKIEAADELEEIYKAHSL